MNTLSDGSTTVTLDDGLHWADRFNWQPVGQVVERSITGRPLVQEAPAVAGQPVTLTGRAPRLGWMRLADLQQCQAWASAPEQMLVLAYQGVTLDVTWHHAKGAIEAEPIQPLTDDDADDFYSVTLRLITL